MSERGGQIEGLRAYVKEARAGALEALPQEKERETATLQAGLEEETAAIKCLETTANEREEEDAAYEGSHS